VITNVRPAFIEFVPDRLEPGVVYISIAFGTMAHSCCCGCGSEVVTPLSPAGWRFDYDGETISLDPSIGNWALACRSHYWIQRNQVVWARRWSSRRIERARREDARDYQQYYDGEMPKSDEPKQ
jgi:hypothetical protein